jgi:hypothetical protein
VGHPKANLKLNKEKIVKNLSKWRKLVMLVAFVLIASMGDVVRSRAFTLIELQYLLPLELLASQTVVVNVSNTSKEPVEAVVDIYGRDGALLVKPTTMTVEAETTLSVTYKQPAGTASNWVRARVGLGTANAVVTDIGILGTNSELVVIANGVKLPPPAFTELLPAVQLVANQSACVFVSNVSTESVSGSIDIYGGDGALLVPQPITVAAGQTYCLTYTHPKGTSAPNNIRAVVNLPNKGDVISDIATFDVKSGHLIALLPFIELE